MSEWLSAPDDSMTGKRIEARHVPSEECPACGCLLIRTDGRHTCPIPPSEGHAPSRVPSEESWDDPTPFNEIGGWSRTPSTSEGE